MDDILIDAQMLATFSNLTPAQAEEFRNSIYPNFLSPDFWKLQSFNVETASGGLAWQSIQEDLQEAWANRFPLDTSIQLITAVDKFSQLEQALKQVPQMSNQEIATMNLPSQEVWPFQRAIMFLAVNSWRARFCPRCGKRFVAAKPKSTYCSEDCSQESRKGSKRGWWGEHGQQLRESKKAAKTRSAKTKKG
jgi:hypothetical protein